MTTRHEAVAAALVTALAAHSAQVLREVELPQRCPAEGLVNILPQDPEQAGHRLGTGVREWVRAFRIELLVQDADPAARVAALDGLMAELGGLLYGATLGGLADFVEIGPPAEAEDIPLDGAASLKGAVVDVRVYYETSDNPMEAL